MTTDKIRTRTPEELEYRRKAFFEMCDVLDKANIPCFLWGGVLLGAMREKDFIEWDWDIEIGVFADGVKGRAQELAALFSAGGFEVFRVDDNYENFKIDMAKYMPAEVSSFTVCSWYKEDDMWVRSLWKIPAPFLDTLGEIEFLGRTFKCPSNPEKFLEYQYGDWRTPKRTADQREYLSAAFFRTDKTKGNVFKKNIQRAVSLLRGLLR
ncbi:LicD family protein [Candidatus Nomurabacteria bacterium]|nr:LicD family protein [Candidatus Nomurabacteria bacterium]